MAHKKTAHKKYRLGFILALAGVCLAPPMPAFGQRQKDPLTDQQIEQLRENGDQPLEKIKLYLGFIEERTAEIQRLNTATNAQNQNRDVQLHNLYQEFTRISDELDDNMDSFAEQHADMRKVLKTVVEDSEKWPSVLNPPKPDGQDDFVRKAALSASQSVHDDAKQLLEEQEKYFAQHKPSS
jgi:neutral trehalase